MWVLAAFGLSGCRGLSEPASPPAVRTAPDVVKTAAGDAGGPEGPHEEHEKDRGRRAHSALENLAVRDPRYLEEALERARLQPEAPGWTVDWFERVSAELVRDPHSDPDWSRRAFEALAEVLGNDRRMASRPWVQRLLQIYLRWDRHSVRKLFAERIGRSARAALQAIMRDPEEQGALRVAAASCSMALGWVERRQGFAFALERLGSPDESERREAAALISHFGGLELLRARRAVRDRAFALLATPRGDAAGEVVRRGLSHPRTAAYVERDVLEALADTAESIELRRALAACLAAPRERAADPVAVGDGLDGVLAETKDPVLRQNALAALARLRSQLEPAGNAEPQPFVNPAAARAWWRTTRARLRP